MINLLGAPEVDTTLGSFIIIIYLTPLVSLEFHIYAISPAVSTFHLPEIRHLQPELLYLTLKEVFWCDF